LLNNSGDDEQLLRCTKLYHSLSILQPVTCKMPS